MLISITFILEEKEEEEEKKNKNQTTQPPQIVLSYISAPKFQESLDRNEGFLQP